MSPSEPHIVLFDGVCNLCIGIVKFIIKRDPERKFRFAAMQSERGQILLKEHGFSSIGFNTFVYISGEEYLEKSTAALRVLKDLGGFWRLLYVFIYIPRPIRDFLYSLIARIRYRIFGKKNRCMMPSSNDKERFLT